MIHIIAGNENRWRERPFISNSNCFVVPPMKFATESCLVMEACIRQGMPVLLLSAGQAGATAPPSIAGAIVQAVAECLAGVVYVNAISPGFIETDITDVLPDSIKTKYMEMIPLAKFGLPEDVAKSVLFLASDDSSYITGEVLKINGGLYT